MNTRVNSIKKKSLEFQFLKNQQYAFKYNISINTNYSVTPFEIGIYPVYQELFNVWSQFSIKAASTQFYPSAHPEYSRRGFIFNNVMVAPRFAFDNLKQILLLVQNEWDLEGRYENLFETVLFNHVSILKTQMTDFANNRLANQLLWTVIKKFFFFFLHYFILE